MPRLKAENSIKKIECKFNLSPDSKELLAQTARHLNLNQNQIIENLIDNFHSNTEIVKNSKYIIERENLLTEIISRVENSIDFNKNLLEVIKLQNEKIENIQKSVIDLDYKFSTNISNFELSIKNLAQNIISNSTILDKAFKDYLDNSTGILKGRVKALHTEITEHIFNKNKKSFFG